MDNDLSSLRDEISDIKDYVKYIAGAMEEIKKDLKFYLGRYAELLNSIKKHETY